MMMKMNIWVFPLWIASLRFQHATIIKVNISTLETRKQRHFNPVRLVVYLSAVWKHR